jgi:hypothetical protein
MQRPCLIALLSREVGVQKDCEMDSHWPLLLRRFDSENPAFASLLFPRGLLNRQECFFVNEMVTMDDKKG